MSPSKNKALDRTRDKESEISLDRIRELISYDPESGDFTWLVTTGKKVKGDKAGGVSEHGYCRVKLAGTKYMAHRLAWAFIYGVFPENEIDHINGIRSDNRKVNLREANRSTNIQNLNSSRKDNKLGVLGVHQIGVKFISQLQVMGVKVHYARHNTLEEAELAYKEAKDKYHSV